MAKTSGSSKKVRYAVVGVGHFAQAAVLPAFRAAHTNSELTALVSGDPSKLKKLGQRYRVQRTCSYDGYDQLLKSGEIDAVYIVLPNTMHKEFAVRAAKAGVHVLCEKPLAMDVAECQSIIDAAEAGRVKLMTAYRLHFEQGNLQIIDLVKKGKIGEPKMFSSVFSHQVQAGNIRTREDVGGGALYDLGVYCINAARYLFRAEPTSVLAVTSNSNPKKFHGVDETATAILRFPNDRVAQFTVSQGAADSSEYRIVGTKGDIHAQPAYEYVGEIAYELTVGGKTKKFKTTKHDQVAAELLYFSNCILINKNPEPSGSEGLADVRIVRAIYRSADSGRAIELKPLMKAQRPNRSQTISRPGHQEPELVHASPPSQS